MKKLMAIVMTGVFLMMATQLYAQDVFITKNGGKYHQETCPLVKSKQLSKISEEEAKDKKLEPCKKCFKNDKLSSNKVENKTSKK